MHIYNLAKNPNKNLPKTPTKTCRSGSAGRPVFDRIGWIGWIGPNRMDRIGPDRIVLNNKYNKVNKY